jgi:flagella basal body P-ring formation protein FlgA
MDVDILARPVPRGSLLAMTDFTRSEAEAGAARFALSASRAAGMAARRDLPRGSVVRAADIAPPPAVRRGEPVRIMLDMAGMLITAQGRALADAAEGESVRVYSTSTNATLTARVTAPGAVALRVY